MSRREDEGAARAVHVTVHSITTTSEGAQPLPAHSQMDQQAPSPLAFPQPAAPAYHRPEHPPQPPSYRRHYTSTAAAPGGGRGDRDRDDAASIAQSISSSFNPQSQSQPQSQSSDRHTTSAMNLDLEHPKVATYFWYGFLFFPLWVWGMLHLIPGIGIRIPKHPSDDLIKPKIPTPVPVAALTDGDCATTGGAGGGGSSESGAGAVARPPSYCESLRTLEQSYPPTQYSALVALRKEEIKWAMRCLYTLATFSSCIGVIAIATLKFVQSQNNVQPEDSVLP